MPSQALTTGSQARSKDDLAGALNKAYRLAVEYGTPLFHWGFIPAIILVGMLCTKPRPTIGQLVLFG